MTINDEICKPIPGFSRYVISGGGHIYRVVALNKIERQLLADNPDKKYIRESVYQVYDVKTNGRWSQVGLVNDAGKFVTTSVEKMLCNTFDLWPKSKDPLAIEMIDGNPKNMQISNLRFTTARSKNTKLTLDQVKEIRKLIAKKNSYKIIASKYGISEMQISRIKSGENWRKGGRKKPIPQPPFEVKDGRMRRIVATFDYSEIDKDIRRPFTLKRGEKSTDIKIIGVTNGYRLSKTHKNISRARQLIFKLNTYFFNENIAYKMENKLKTKAKPNLIEV